MSVSAKWWLFVGALVLGASALAVIVAPTSNQGFKDAASVIAFATMLAVGIERSFEIAWTLVDQAKSLGAYWPMSSILPHLTAIDTQTNQLLGPIFDTAKTALTTARDAAGAGSGEFARFQSALADLETTRSSAHDRFTLAKGLAPGSPRIANAGAAADAMAKQLSNAFDLADDAIGSGKTALDDARIRAQSALDIIGTLGDNPARRLSSLLLGAAVGALVAGFVGVNLFAAIVSGGPSLLDGKLGILITGLVAGLGSGPTHELVKSLQANKNSGQLQVVGTLSDASSDQGVLSLARRVSPSVAQGVSPVVIRRTE